jgi:hypothetical protein
MRSERVCVGDTYIAILGTCRLKEGPSSGATRDDPEGLTRLFHRDRVRQEWLDKTSHRSPKWETLRSLHQVYGARKVRGCSIIDAPPSFESVGREEREPREEMDCSDEGSPPPLDSKKTTTTVFETSSPRIVPREEHSKVYVDVVHCTVNTFIHKQHISLPHFKD